MSANGSRKNYTSVRFRVEVKEGEGWRPYRDGRRFRDQWKAEQLLARVQDRFPGYDLRVAVAPSTADREPV